MLELVPFFLVLLGAGLVAVSMVGPTRAFRAHKPDAGSSRQTARQGADPAHGLVEDLDLDRPLSIREPSVLVVGHALSRDLRRKPHAISEAVGGR
jgi:hypothetical protein